MPTKDWFKANPKVSAYLSAELNQALQNWMKERRIKKVSVGLTTILEEFLRVNQDKLPVGQNLISLEQFEELQRRVEVLEQGAPKVDQSKPKVEQKSLEIEVEPEKEEPSKPVAQSKLKSSLKTKKETPDKTATQNKPINNSIGNDEWLTTKEAHEKYGGKTKYGTFRKMKTEQLKERFGLEADESQKGSRGKAGRWLRKVD